MAKRRLTVTLPVRDLKRSTEFFSKLGFEFDPQMTGEAATCMLMSGGTAVMLGAEPFFKTLTERTICDTSTHFQALFALACESRAEVDELVKLAVANGGKAAGDAQDHGFMYDWSFYDLDGHGWGVFWMAPPAGQK